jgi:hypothetical protein
MQDSSELREHYRALLTDELLAISVSGELTDTAKTLLSAELRRRGVTTEDYEYARQVETKMPADREETREEEFARRIKLRLWLIGAVVLAVTIVAIANMLRR